jgi:hypothetical protein
MRIGKLASAVLAVIVLAIGIHAPEAQAQNDRNPTENSPADRALEGKRLDTIHLAMPDSYATLSQIAVVTSDCAFRGTTSPTMRRNVNKVGITQDMPWIGQFFAATPRQGELNAGNQIGLAYADDSTLYVDLRSAGAPPTGDRSLLGALVSGPTGQSAPFALNAAAQPFVGFSVVNRDFQFQVPVANFTALAPARAACGSNAMTKLPLMASYFPQAAGSVHLLRGQMIVLVKPSIIAGY